MPTNKASESQYIMNLSLEALHRKLNQAYELAGCARTEGDEADAANHIRKAQAYKAELKRRRELAEKSSPTTEATTELTKEK